MTGKVLVIDDDVEYANLLKLVLSKKGYETKVAYGGVHGLGLAKSMSPAVIVQDFMLPDYKGLKLLEDLRESCPQSYVIIITAKGSEEVAVEIMKAGASDYLKKPFETEKLLMTVENVMKLRSAELDRESLNREVMQQNKELLALNAISLTLTSKLPPQDKYSSASGIVLKNMEADMVNLFTSGDAGRLSLKLAASESDGVANVTECTLGRKVGLVSYVAEIGKAAVVADFGTEKRFKVPKELIERGLTSAIGVPVTVKGKLKGVLAAYYLKPTSFQSLEMKLMASFANQIALAMDNDELSDMVGLAGGRLQATLDAVTDRIIVLDVRQKILMANEAAGKTCGFSAAELVGQDCCWVFHNSKLPIPDCPTAEAFRTGKPVCRELDLDMPKGKFLVWAYPVTDGDGNVDSVVEYVREIRP